MVVIWEPLALNDFECQYRWYSENLGQSAANKFRKGIMSDVELIAANPMIGRLNEDLCRKYGEQIWRSIISGRKYRIVYCIEDQIVRIHMIWRCVRDEAVIERIIKKGK